MADLTDEEYDALDEYYTRNPPKVDLAKNGLTHMVSDTKRGKPKNLVSGTAVIGRPETVTDTIALPSFTVLQVST